MKCKSSIEALAILTLLVSVSAGMQTFNVAKANPVPYPNAPNTDLLVLHIDTPENYSTTYANNTLNMVFRVVEPPTWNSYKDQLGIIYEPIVGDFSVWVYLDGNITFTRQNEATYNELVYDYNVTFANLTLDQHNATIDVCARAFYTTSADWSQSVYETNMSQTALFTLYPDSQSIQFTENPIVITRDPYPISSPSPTTTPTVASTAVPLTTSILSPVNGSGFLSILEDNTSPDVSFPLIYKTNEAPSWVGYSIDGNSNVTVTENGTILDLPPLIGNNTLTLYANDTLGNWATPQTVTFFIVPTTVVPSPTPSHSPLPSPSESPTPQPTPTLTFPMSSTAPPIVDYAPTEVTLLAILALTVAIGVLAYFYFEKRKGQL